MERLSITALGERPPATAFLTPKDRPSPLKARIDTAFRQVEGKSFGSNWGRFGSKNYQLCAIEPAAILKALIGKEPLRQVFYVVDVGTNSIWSRSLSKHLNKDEELTSRDLTIHIFDLGGEKLSEDLLPEERSGICHIHRYGSFKIEELSLAFSEKGVNLRDRVDLCVTRCCLTHLCDPVGTLLQMLDLIRPGSGLLFADEFAYYSESASSRRITLRNTLRILLHTRIPFLQGYFKDQMTYIVQKPRDTAILLPLAYQTKEPDPSDLHPRAATLLRELEEPVTTLPIECRIERMITFRGDFALFESLRQMGLITPALHKHAPLVASDMTFATPPPPHLPVPIADADRPHSA
jgi:hypothetical protein